MRASSTTNRFSTHPVPVSGTGIFLPLCGDNRRTGENRSQIGMNQNYDMCWTYTGIFVPNTPAPVSGAGIFLVSARRIRRRAGKYRSNSGAAPHRGTPRQRRICCILPRFRGRIFFFIRDTSPRYPVSKRYMGNTPVSHETIITNSANKIKP